MRGYSRSPPSASSPCWCTRCKLPRPEWSSYYLINLNGNPVETATAAASLVLGGVFEQLAYRRICLPRKGFANLWFDTLTHDGPMLGLLAAQADPSHLRCGSDYPFDMGVELPRGAGIDDAALELDARL